MRHVHAHATQVCSWMAIIFRRSLLLLRLLAECDTWIGDGTFEFAPDKFAQMYSIHGFTKGFNVRLAYFCLPNKKTKSYVTMFEMLKRLTLERTGLTLKPKTILLDFEDAPMSAVRQCFPGTTIRACRFHFSQNLTKVSVCDVQCNCLCGRT